MKADDENIKAGLKRIERFKKLSNSHRDEGPQAISSLAGIVLLIGLCNIFLFLLPPLLPDPLWAIFLPFVTFPLNLIIGIYALSDIKYRNLDGKELVFIGLFLNALFLYFPLSIMINPPTF